MAKARRAHGAGALYQRKDGMWIGAVDVGWKPDGSRDRRQVSSKSKARAKEKLDELRSKVQTGHTPPARSMTVKAWLDQWLDNLRVAPMTERSYRETSRLYLVPQLGRRRVDQLAPQHVRDMLKWVERATDKGGLGLSAHTAHRAHRVLRIALNAAVDEGLVAANVAKRVQPPSIGGKEQPSLTAEQGKALLRSLKGDDPRACRWAVGLLLGLRRGEALGLEWSRVDLDTGTIDVSWQLQRLGYRHGCGGTCTAKKAGWCPAKELDVPDNFVHRPLYGSLCLTRPKTKKARVIPLPAMILAALWAHHEAFGTNVDGLVFTRDEGLPMDPDDENPHWHTALARAGLPQMKPHAARHTTATLLLELGVPELVAQQILGHSSAATTRGYQHVSLDLSRAAMGALGDLLQIEERRAG